MDHSAKAKEILESGFEQADNVLEDEEGLFALLAASKSKINELGSDGAALDKAKVFAAMLEDYSIGAYVQESKESLVAITSALMYLVDPFDAIPDIVPIVGLNDDKAVIEQAYAIASAEVDAYWAWKQE